MRPERQHKINLLYYLQEGAKQQRQLRQTAITVALATVLLVAAAAWIWWNQNQQVKALEQQNQQLQKQVADLNQVAAMAGGFSNREVKALSLRKVLLSNLEEKRTIDPEQLKDIYALGVPDITIAAMDIKYGGEITINAYTDHLVKLIEFVEKIQKEDFVKQIQHISSRRTEKTGEISFTLVIAGEVASQ